MESKQLITNNVQTGENFFAVATFGGLGVVFGRVKKLVVYLKYTCSIFCMTLLWISREGKVK